MRSLFTHADELLRIAQLPAGAAGAAGSRRRLLRHVVILTLFGLLYGAVMGTFGGAGFQHLRQPAYSAVKVPVLLIVTFLLSLPSFFVLNSVLGVRADFRTVLGNLVATQAVLTVVLAALAPFTAFFYASFDDYQAALAFNMLTFTVASVSTQMVLRRWYRPLILRNPRHRLLLRTWLVIYAFVGIQMGWTLRPFIGGPGMPTRFFREGAFGNAYVEVAGILWRLLRAR